MRKIFFSLFFVSPFIGFGQDSFDYTDEQVEVHMNHHFGVVMGAQELYDDNWNDLAQPLFWKQVMTMSPDSVLINVAETRQVLCKMASNDWQVMSNKAKEEFKKDLRTEYSIAAHMDLYVTSGKSHFYKFDAVYPDISKGIEAFEKNAVDPWYAQAILLIESPGQLKMSKTGAYGAFQLMPDVARAQGLTVTAHRDDRVDFNKSAYAASRLISRVCIPEAKKILNAHQIAFNESDVWFRLFVMHIYHAGATNVAAVVRKINPTEGGQKLIQEMWQNKAASFGNNSQNYSQIALASQFILHEMIQKECKEIYYCKFP